MAGDARVVEDEVDPGVEEGVLVLAEDGAAAMDSIPWLATSVGYVAIWPMTIPTLVARQ